MKKIILLLMLVSKIYAQTTVSLSWDSTTDTNVVGHKLYLSDNFFVSNSIEDLGVITNHVITNVIFNTTYSVYITATNSSNLESEPSNIIRFTKFLSSQRTNFFDLSQTINTILETNNIITYPKNGIIYGEFPYITYIYTNSIPSTNDYFKISTGESSNVVDNYYLITLSFTRPDPPVNFRIID